MANTWIRIPLNPDEEDAPARSSEAITPSNTAIDIGVTAATGSIAMPTNPTEASWIILNGVQITFVTGTPDLYQVAIGVSATATMAALVTFLQASTEQHLLQATYSGGSTTLNITAALTPTQSGAAGNKFIIATNVTGATPSGATLTGGSNGHTYKSIWNGGATANIQVLPVLNDDAAPITYIGVPAGTLLKVHCRRVLATLTTATALIGNIY